MSTGFKESREEAPTLLANLIEELKKELLYSSKKKSKKLKYFAK